MFKIIKIAAVCLIFSYFIMRVDESNKLQGKDKDKKLTALMVTILSFYCGLRTWYNDTGTYKQMYARTYLFPEFFEKQGASFAHGYGFELINSIIKTIGFSEQDFFLFYSFIVFILYFIFIRRFSENLLFSVFLFFTNSWFVFSVASIKQCVATGFCLLAFSNAADKKWLKFYFWVLIASLFHPYALIYLITPLMTYKPWTTQSYFYIIAFVIAGFALSTFMGTIMDITELIGADYAEDEFSGAGVNILRVAVCLAPTAVGFLYRGDLFKNSTKSEDMMFNLCMVNGLIMFVGMFGTANYFARLGNYFLPMQVIVLPWMVKRIKSPDSSVISFIATVGYAGYSYYENALNKHFDAEFGQMNFFDYLRSHF